jgi:hypothetical protein
MGTFKQWSSEVDRVIGNAFPGQRAASVAVFDGRALWRSGWPAAAWAYALVSQCRAHDAVIPRPRPVK